MAAPVYRGAQVAGPAPVTLVTAGPASVGKTALINRFCNDTFNEVNTAYLSHKQLDIKMHQYIARLACLLSHKQIA